MDGWTELQERHIQTILRPRILKQDQTLQNYSVLRSHKPGSLQLCFPARRPHGRSVSFLTAEF